MIRQRTAITLASTLLICGFASLPRSGGALARPADSPQAKTQKADGKPREGAAPKTEQVGGEVRAKDEKSPRKDQSVQREHGRLLRPMVSEGGAGPQAVEEGTFSLAPGDMLELEGVAPKNENADMTFKIEDEHVVKLLPTGVRMLVPVSMIGGEPKPITGLVRYTALFQAEKEGETTIRMTLGRKEFQYKVKIAKKKDNGSDEQ